MKWYERLTPAAQRKVAGIMRDRDYYREKAEASGDRAARQSFVIDEANAIINEQNAAIRNVAEAIVAYSKRREKRMVREKRAAKNQSPTDAQP